MSIANLFWSNNNNQVIASTSNPTHFLSEGSLVGLSASVTNKLPKQGRCKSHRKFMNKNILELNYFEEGKKQIMSLN